MISWDPKKARTAAIISNAVMVKGLLIAGGYYLGKRLDLKFGTDPYLMMLGTVLAFALGLWWLVMVLNRLRL